MKPSPTAEPAAFVAVGDLEVGMYIELDVGWMSHPFALSSFRLTEPGQIETLRGLGLERVRWLPERSDAKFGPAPARPAAGLSLVVPEGSAEAGERRRRRQVLARQRAALRRVERQFAEASAECQRVFESCASQPLAAGKHSEALTRSLLEKMRDADRDISIRLVGEVGGDRTALHALNVSVLALLLGRVFGLPDEEMRELGIGALLHDVGKSELPERMRWPAEHFTPSERRYHEEHVALGVKAGRRMGLGDGALLVIGQHHEHVDGSGFPQRSSSERQSIAARIVALVDRYDELCNPQLPAAAPTPHEALSLMFAQCKNQFDPAIMGAFIKMMGVYPPGSAVQLTDDRYALVTAVNSSRPLKPRVIVHDPKVPREEAPLLDLQLEPGLGIRRSLKAQALPRPVRDYLGPRPRALYFIDAEPEPLAA
jgi:putative nucleotidyltransferase with HDIG domain